MARPEKEAVVAEFQEQIESAAGVYVADYQGLNVEQISELRAAMRAENVKMRVAKNTLVRIAARRAGQDELSDILTGPNAFIFGFDDPVVPARIIREFKRKARVEKPVVGGFLIEGKFMPAERFDEVADLPAKAALVGRVVGSIQSPLSSLVFTLQGILRELVGTVEAVRDQKQGKD